MPLFLCNLPQCWPRSAACPRRKTGRLHNHHCNGRRHQAGKGSHHDRQQHPEHHPAGKHSAGGKRPR
nr:MAG TPA: hypothetical protein [Caudoviricetes sp.]